MRSDILTDFLFLDDEKMNYVISALNLIDVNLKSFAYIENQTPLNAFRSEQGRAPVEPKKERYPYARIKDTALAIPMKSMGRGINRILGIMLILMSAENGIALIDDLEDGLSKTVYEKLLDLIFKIAEKFSIQVFITSKNEGVLNYFDHISKSNERGVVYKLNSQVGERHA